MLSAASPAVLATSHIRISVRYSWSVQTWFGTVKVKMSVDGSRPCSTIHRPIRMCHQKSGSCSALTKSARVTINTMPSSRVRAVSRSVSCKTLLARPKRVGKVAGDAPGVNRVLVWKGLGEDAFLEPDTQELAGHEVDDREPAQPAGGGNADPDRRDDLAEVDGVAAQGIGTAGDQAAGFR